MYAAGSRTNPNMMEIAFTGRIDARWAPATAPRATLLTPSTMIMRQATTIRYNEAIRAIVVYHYIDQRGTMPKRKLDPLPGAAFQILLSLADADRHGYGIMKQVEEQTEGRMRLGPGTLYGSVQSLLEEKLIEEVEPRGGAKAGEERRRYYRLTPGGRKLARSEAERLADMLRVARVKKIFRGEYV
jgi:DNA-binding PadR family transcriptional regulator